MERSNDVPVIQFKTSDYVSHVSWSPDGTQLAFDLGPQAIGPLGFPYLLAVPSSNALYTINVDGTGLNKLRDAPATWPAWSPLPASAPAARLTASLSTNRQQLVIAWPTAAGAWVLESTAQLGPQANWQAVPGAPVADGAQQSLTLGVGGLAQFYRLRPR